MCQRASLPEYCITKNKHCNYVLFGFPTTSVATIASEKVRKSYPKNLSLCWDTFECLKCTAAFSTSRSPVQCVHNIFSLLFSLITKVERHSRCWYVWVFFWEKFYFPISCLVTMHSTLHQPEASLKSAFRFHPHSHFFVCPEYAHLFRYRFAWFSICEGKKMPVKDVFSLRQTSKKKTTGPTKKVDDNHFDIILQW